MTTVQGLIDELQKIEDKSKTISLELGTITPSILKRDTEFGIDERETIVILTNT